MALSKEQYFSMGCADAQTSPPNRQGHLYASTSWQGRAYTEGFAQGAIYAARARTAVKAVDAHVEERLGLPSTAVQSIAPTLQPGDRTTHASTLTNPAEIRRDKRIDAIVRGFIAAVIFTTTDEDGNNVDDHEFDDDGRGVALRACTAFYDRHTTDLGAFAGTYQPVGGYDVWECAGHDLWLTMGGHGAGFWDRGLGRLGARLTKAAEAFAGIEAYATDTGTVLIDAPFHSDWMRG